MPAGHYVKRGRYREPRYILPDEVEAIREQIAREAKKKNGRGLELARGRVASHSSGLAAPSRGGTVPDK